MQFAQATSFIDTIKTTKETIIKSLVTDKTFSEPLQAMVEAEAKLAKATVTAIDEMIAKFKVM